jgi:CubicO group peptidase (beta-lactamase class C family)
MVGRRAFLGAASAGLIAGWDMGAALAGPTKSRARTTAKKKKDQAKAKDSLKADDAPLEADERINRILEPVRNGRNVPGLIGAIVRGDRVAAIGAIGIRKIGSPEPIRVGDLVHLGSCTKPMTATLAGMLVDEGKVSWKTTLADVFPGHAPRLHPDFQGVTLLQLLNHRAGLPHDVPWWGLGPGRSTTDQRRALLDRALAAPPLSKPGTAYAYSNVGYVLAGLMAEQVTGASWESLMRDRLFGPLGMSTAGFGAPGTPGKVDQPWGHRVKGGQVEPTRQDNAPCMGPAATVHCSVVDWAKFATLHMRGGQGKGRLLKPATFRTLQTPPRGQEYAGGWFALDRTWAGGRALNHKGSNTTWFATIWIAPARDFATLVAANQGGDTADATCEEATEALLRYLFS